MIVNILLGFFSRITCINIRELTIIVLIHELTHDYTHLGYDIDGYNWDTSSFVNTDKLVVEGLAQFYTEILCERFNEHIPYLSKAFNHMLNFQSELYHIHKKLRNNLPNAGEIIRASMLYFRKKNQNSYKSFEDNIIKFNSILS